MDFKLTSDQRSKIVSERRTAWEWAVDMVTPIIDRHELSDYRSGSPFGPGTIITEVDQHIDHILRVADWLLEN